MALVSRNKDKVLIPWKHEVGHAEAIPGRVFEEGVAARTVVHEDHERDGDSAEGVQGLDATFGLLVLFLIVILIFIVVLKTIKAK